jgi:hypothetical protein
MQRLYIAAMTGNRATQFIMYVRLMPLQLRPTGKVNVYLRSIGSRVYTVPLQSCSLFIAAFHVTMGRRRYS